MPIITVCGLPANLGEELLQSLDRALIASAISIKELKLTSKDITCFFQADLMRKGLGKEIIVFVDGLYEKPERTPKVRSQFFGTLGSTVKFYFSSALVEVIPRRFDQEACWSSAANGVQASTQEVCVNE